MKNKNKLIKMKERRLLLRVCPQRAIEIAQLLTESAALVDTNFPLVYLMIGLDCKIEVGNSMVPQKAL